MDKLKEKFQDRIEMNNDKAEVCAEVTKEVIEKWDKWKLKEGWDLMPNGNYINNQGEVKTSSELFTIFIEQEKI